VSAFGGIVALNRPVDAALAAQLSETFLECVIAPGYDEAALALLAKKKNVRLLRVPFVPRVGFVPPQLRSVSGGVLAQSRDDGMVSIKDAKVVTRRAPTAAELASLDFAWRVAKHVKSNAIVFARDGVTIGVGAGQMSRIDSTKIAVMKARTPVAGSVRLSLTRGAVTSTAPALVSTSLGW